MSFLDVLKSKKSFIEGSQTNIPVTNSNEALSEVIDRFLDVKNVRQLSVLQKRERAHAAILDAYSFAKDEYDVGGFLDMLVQNMFMLSSSVEGQRSAQLQNIAVGQMNREYALELARIRSGEGNKELKDVV